MEMTYAMGKTEPSPFRNSTIMTSDISSPQARSNHIADTALDLTMFLVLFFKYIHYFSHGFK